MTIRGKFLSEYIQFAIDNPTVFTVLDAYNCYDQFKELGKKLTKLDENWFDNAHFEDVILAVQMQLIDLHKSCLKRFLA